MRECMKAQSSFSVSKSSIARKTADSQQKKNPRIRHNRAQKMTAMESAHMNMQKKKKESGRTEVGQEWNLLTTAALNCCHCDVPPWLRLYHSSI